MPILVVRKRKKPDPLLLQRSDVEIFDVTYNGPRPWLKFSPFYPHGSIPVPLSPGYVAASVEAIWHGLAVFDNVDIDTSAFAIATMSGLKRAARGRSATRGYRAGVNGATVLTLREARYHIYLPAYRWVFDNCVQWELELLQSLSLTQTVILLDYETNADPDDLSRSLSAAALVARYLANQWPYLEGPIEST